MQERTITGRKPSEPPAVQRMRSQDPEVRRVVDQIAALFGREKPDVNHLVFGPLSVEALAKLDSLADIALKEQETLRVLQIQSDLMRNPVSVGSALLDLDVIEHLAKSKEFIKLDSVEPALLPKCRYTGRALLAMTKASHRYLDFHGMKRHGN